MSLVATTRSSFLPRQTPTDRSDNNLPSQRLSPPCQEQVEPQFLHFPFFSSSCLRSPLMHLLRKYSEKLGIPGQSPELHSHALRDTTTRNKDRSPSLTVKNPRQNPTDPTETEELLPPAGNTQKKQSPDQEPNIRSRQGSPRPARPPPHSLRPRPGLRARCAGEAATPNRAPKPRPLPPAEPRSAAGNCRAGRGGRSALTTRLGPPDPPGERHLDRVRRPLGSWAAEEEEGGGTCTCAVPAAWPGSCSLRTSLARGGARREAARRPGRCIFAESLFISSAFLFRSSALFTQSPTSSVTS